MRAGWLAGWGPGKGRGEESRVQTEAGLSWWALAFLDGWRDGWTDGWRNLHGKDSWTAVRNDMSAGFGKGGGRFVFFFLGDFVDVLVIWLSSGLL